MTTMNSRCGACTGGWQCGNKSPEGFFCNREHGHTGIHVACGDLTHHLREWPRAEAQQEQAAQMGAR